MPDAFPDDLQATLSDRYQIERELGRGGMATVYLARDLRHERLVALKVLRPDLGAALGRERFTREIKLAAGLQHPHIAGRTGNCRESTSSSAVGDDFRSLTVVWKQL